MKTITHAACISYLVSVVVVDREKEKERERG